MGLSWTLPFNLVALLWAASVVNGQVIPPPDCTCSFETYRFRLDFSLSCPPVNVTTPGAVQQTTCVTDPRGDPSVTDLIPVRVDEISIVELNYLQQPIDSRDYSGNFGNNFEFTYESVVARSDITAPQDIPVFLAGFLVGVNAEGEGLNQNWGIQFTNNCDVYPVLNFGADVGWVEFIGGQGGNFDFCQAAPTATPTPAPTPGPTPMPVTPAPTSPPITPTPTISTFAPTGAPTITPPTLPPVTSGPTSMSMSMSMSYSLEGEDFSRVLSLLEDEFGEASSQTSEVEREHGSTSDFVTSTVVAKKRRFIAISGGAQSGRKKRSRMRAF